MKCPICEAPLRPGVTRCPDCGYRIPGTQSVPAEPSAGPRATYTPPNQSKKRSGCCCCAAILLPVLLLVIGAIFSFAEFVMEDFEIATPEPGWYEDEPFAQEPEDLIPESIPTPAGDDCFLLVDDALRFIPENWDGSPILNVPGTIDGEPVTAIGPDCFRDCTDLTTIILPETILSIDRNAFSGCSKLRGLYLPEGVVSIGQDAFAGCIDMEAIYIPSSVQSIADHAFDDCASLRFIFYGGNFEDWDALYDDYINPFTSAVCLDGYYYHGAED